MIVLAPQVGLEPTTLRLTGKQNNCFYNRTCRFAYGYSSVPGQGNCISRLGIKNGISGIVKTDQMMSFSFGCDLDNECLFQAI